MYIRALQKERTDTRPAQRNGANRKWTTPMAISRNLSTLSMSGENPAQLSLSDNQPSQGDTRFRDGNEGLNIAGLKKVGIPELNGLGREGEGRENK